MIKTSSADRVGELLQELIPQSDGAIQWSDAEVASVLFAQLAEGTWCCGIARDLSEAVQLRDHEGLGGALFAANTALTLSLN